MPLCGWFSSGKTALRNPAKARAFLLMVYAEDEVLAPFFLKKNGFRGAHPVSRIRRNALQEA
jgi:hypothetical protein